MSDDKQPNTPSPNQDAGDASPDASRSYVGPTAIPATRELAMEKESVVISPEVDPRRAPTQRRLDRPPMAAPPHYLEATEQLPAIDGRFAAAPALAGPGQLTMPLPATTEAPASVRTIGGHTERLKMGSDSPPPPPADPARIRAELTADGSASDARTLGGHTERLAHVPAHIVAAGGEPMPAPIAEADASASTRTVGGRTERLQVVPADVAAAAAEELAGDAPTESSRWATDPHAGAAPAVNRDALPSNYAATLSGEKKSPIESAVASSKPPRNNNNLIIGVLAVLVVGAGAFLALRGSSENGAGAAGSAAPISIPAPKLTSTSDTALPAEEPQPTAADTTASALPSSAPAALTGRLPVVKPVSTSAVPAAKTSAPAAPTGPTLPPQIF